MGVEAKRGGAEGRREGSLAAHTDVDEFSQKASREAGEPERDGDPAKPKKKNRVYSKATIKTY